VRKSTGFAVRLVPQRCQSHSLGRGEGHWQPRAPICFTGEERVQQRSPPFTVRNDAPTGDSRGWWNRARAHTWSGKEMRGFILRQRHRVQRPPLPPPTVKSRTVHLPSARSSDEPLTTSKPDARAPGVSGKGVSAQAISRCQWAPNVSPRVREVPVRWATQWVVYWAGLV
jgi:hypothetical protein